MRTTERGRFQGLTNQRCQILIPAPLCFVIVDFVGISTSNSTRVCVDLQCPNTAAEEHEGVSAKEQ